MKKKLTIAFVLLATPFVLAKLIDVHLPTGEELYIEQMKEQDRENNRAYDILNDENSSELERNEAYNILMDNGKMA